MKRLVFLLLWLALAISSLSFTAEFFAFLAGYPEILGPRGLIVIYDPTQYIHWVMTLSEKKGHAFEYSMYFLEGLLLIEVLGLLFFLRTFTNKIRNDLASGRWMNTSELKKLRLLREPGKTDVFLGLTDDAKYKSLKDGSYKLTSKGKMLYSSDPEHILVVAPTRRGKGIHFILPSLLHWMHSVVVVDIKKENWNLTSGWRRLFSTTLVFEPTAGFCARWNPLDEIMPGDGEVAGVQNVATMISNVSGDENVDHWKLTAQALISGVILFVLKSERCKDKCLRGVYYTIANADTPFVDVLEEMAAMGRLPDGSFFTDPSLEYIRSSAKAVLNMAANERSGVVSTAITYLKVFSEENVGRATEASDFNIADLVYGKYPVSLYLVIHPSDADRLKPLTRLFLQLVGLRLTDDIEKAKYRHKLLVVADEFPTLGNMEFFENQLAFLAGYNIRMAIIVQAVKQLRKHYTKDTSILDNCKYKIFLGADDPEDAQYISKLLGEKQISKQGMSESEKDGSLGMSSRSKSTSDETRPLMAPDEVLRLPFTDYLLVIGGSHPYRGSKEMVFLDPRFKPKYGTPAPSSVEEQKKEFKTLGKHRSPWALLPLEPLDTPETPKPTPTEGKGRSYASRSTGVKDISDLPQMGEKEYQADRDRIAQAGGAKPAPGIRENFTKRD